MKFNQVVEFFFADVHYSLIFRLKKLQIMNTNHLLLATTLFFTAMSQAQLEVKDITFSPTGVSNEGKVAGYEMQGGPFALWLPDSGNVVVQIGGTAPGNGIGGQARFSLDGNLISGTSIGTDGAEMSTYNRSSNQWTTRGSFGFVVDNSVGGGYAISGDGNTVVGNAWADTAGGMAYTHAIASNLSDGIIDLGTLFAGKSTRANAISHNGNVIVGWQDFNGPWKSAVWRKNPGGGYFPNEYILLDPNGSSSDEFNQMGECTAVSGDGTWIGGYGDYANNYQPWIWSQDSGVVNLGSFPNVGNGFVSGMSADGSTVIGWFDGQLFGDPQTPFIWSFSTGLLDLNSYLHSELNYPIDEYQLYTADCISPDGHFISGYGVNTNSFTYFVYRLSLDHGLSVMELSNQESFELYPNPSNDLVNFSKSLDSYRITNSMGQEISRGNGSQFSTIHLAEGVYFLESESILRKFVVRH